MTRSRRDAEGQDAEPFLFDLPLGPDRDERPPEDELPAPAPVRRERAAPQERAVPRPRAPELAHELPAVPARPAAVPRDEAAASAEPVQKSARGARLAAGIADLVVHAALLVLAAGGARLLGARPSLADGPAFAALLAVFSFLYTVLPLAFWGQTLGMSWAGLSSRSRDGEPLTFDQAARRWVGALLTAATVGIPLLLAGERRSLSDLVSGSATYPAI